MITTKLTKNNLSVPSVTFETGTLTSDDKGILIWNDSPVGSNGSANLETSNFHYLTSVRDGSTAAIDVEYLDFSNQELSEEQLIALSLIRCKQLEIQNAIIKGSEEIKANLNFNFSFDIEEFKSNTYIRQGNDAIYMDYYISPKFSTSAFENVIIYPFYFTKNDSNIAFIESTLSNCELYASKLLHSPYLINGSLYIRNCVLTNCNIFIDKTLADGYHSMLVESSCGNTCTNVKIYDFDNNLLFEL